MVSETIQQSPETRESRYTARTIGQVAQLEYNTKLINILCYLYSKGFPQKFFIGREMSWLEAEDIEDSKVRIDALLDSGTREDWDKHFPGLSIFEDFEWEIIYEVQVRYKVQRNIELSEDNHLLVQENTRLKKTLTAMGVSASIIILYLAYNLYREENTSEESTPPRSKIIDMQEPLPQGTTFAIL